MILVTLFAILLSVFIFSTSANGFRNLLMDYHEEGLTEEQKLNMSKVNDRLNSAWSDIKKSFEIDEKRYFQVDLSKRKEFQEGQSVIQDKDQVESILNEVINPNMDEVPIGSIRPLILVSNDGNEVLFCYKEADGTNVLKKIIFRDGNWIKEVQRRKGEPIEPMG